MYTETFCFGEIMTDTPVMTLATDVGILLKEAREAHERFLIKQQDSDLEKAIEWIKKPENQKKLFEAGIAVFKLAFKKIKK